MMKSFMLLMKPGKSGAMDVPILRKPFSTVACDEEHGSKLKGSKQVIRVQVPKKI